MSTGTQSNVIIGTSSTLSYVNNPAIALTQNGKKVLEVSNEGEVSFLFEGGFKKVECDADIALMFYIVVCEMTGYSVDNKDELMSKIIGDYRNGKLNKILK